MEGDGYAHGAATHGAKEFARYDYQTGATHHTNTVESFKTSGRCMHVHVSPKSMWRCLGEFMFLANHREMRNAMFDLLIAAV